MEKQLAIGIIGAGKIAHKFAEGIGAVPSAFLYAVASRDGQKAAEFAKNYGATKSFDSYEKMLQDEKVDLIYIATPNGLHKEHALLCLNHKKHVICEKPFTANADELREVIACAKKHDVFLMEAMWTRYFPVIKAVRKLVEKGALGKIRLIQGDFGFCTQDREGIKFNKELAGGALMDVGIYPISFASMILKKQPSVIKAIAMMSESGVDEQTNIIFGYEDGAAALLSCAMTLETPRNAYIVGEKGSIHIPNPWFAKKAIVQIHGEDTYEIIGEDVKNGYHFEIEEAARCILNNQKESKHMKLEESLELMETLDRVRVKMGLKFTVDQ